MNRLRASLLATVAMIGVPALALAQDGQPLPDIDVTTDAPTAAPAVAVPAAGAPGGGVAGAPFNFTQDVTPSNNTRIDAKEIERTESPSAADTLQRLVPGVDIQSTSGNSLSPDVVYRGFVSSPIQGTPQGIAVYQNGVRVNEAFGDTMNWDMLPTFAIASMDMISNNPVFGLNALGGAVNIKMKDGFTYQGGKFEISGGSFGRVQGAADYGKQVGNFAFYGALEGVTDGGFREFGGSTIRRFYGDLGYRAEGNEFHLTAGLSDNLFGVDRAGADPVAQSGLEQRLYIAADLAHPVGTDRAFGQFLLVPDLEPHRQRLCPPLHPAYRRRQPDQYAALRRPDAALLQRYVDAGQWPERPAARQPVPVERRARRDRPLGHPHHQRRDQRPALQQRHPVRLQEPRHLRRELRLRHDRLQRLRRTRNRRAELCGHRLGNLSRPLGQSGLHRPRRRRFPQPLSRDLCARRARPDRQADAVGRRAASISPRSRFPTSSAAASTATINIRTSIRSSA